MQVRQQGYALTQDELEIGLTAVAAPIFNSHNEVQAALCIGAPSSRITPKLEDLTTKVKETAEAISIAIGYDQKATNQHNVGS